MSTPESMPSPQQITEVPSFEGGTVTPPPVFETPDTSAVDAAKAAEAAAERDRIDSLQISRLTEINPDNGEVKVINYSRGRAPEVEVTHKARGSGFARNVLGRLSSHR